MANRSASVSQCQRPTGWLGRFTLYRMNKSHSKLTDWGLTHITVRPRDIILDVGCGGGRTISKLAALAAQGKVHGIDYSPDSVAVSEKTNAASIAAGAVEIREGSVSQLPFADGSFDLVTAVETHFWWPDLRRDIREVSRVTKPGGQLAVVAEVYKGAAAMASRLIEKYAAKTGLQMLTPEEHRELLASAGYSDIQIDTLPEKGWICAVGRKA